MASSWQETEFRSLCDITRGASPRPIHEWISEGGVPWIKISDAPRGKSRFIESTREKIREEGRTKSVSVFPGDLILSNSATPGIPMFVAIEACIHDGWLLLRNFRGLDKLFCYYLLQEERPRLVRQATGSVFTNLKTEILKRHRIQLPPVSEQRRIAAILGALDDKIELNRRMNRTLEEMAQAIFKSWFIDFDGHADLVDSELGPIPGEWEIGKVAALADLNPMVWRKKTAPSLIRYLDLKNVKWGEVGDPVLYEFSKAPSRARRVLLDGDTIIGTVRPANGSYGLIQEPGENLTGSTGFAVLRPKTPASRYFVYLWLTRPGFIDYLASVAHGSAYPAVSPDLIHEAELVVPDPEALEQFHAVVEPMYLRLNSNGREARTLAELRDTLLPKLVSGEVRVPEAAEAIEEAV